MILERALLALLTHCSKASSILFNIEFQIKSKGQRGLKGLIDSSVQSLYHLSKYALYLTCIDTLHDWSMSSSTFSEKLHWCKLSLMGETLSVKVHPHWANLFLFCLWVEVSDFWVGAKMLPQEVSEVKNIMVGSFKRELLVLLSVFALVPLLHCVCSCSTSTLAMRWDVVKCRLPQNIWKALKDFPWIKLSSWVLEEEAIKSISGLKKFLKIFLKIFLHLRLVSLIYAQQLIEYFWL